MNTKQFIKEVDITKLVIEVSTMEITGWATPKGETNPIKQTKKFNVDTNEGIILEIIAKAKELANQGTELKEE